MSGDLDSRSIKTGKYRHYKGNEYQVIGTAYHSETEELLVLYKPLYDDEGIPQSYWVRPYDMFIESVEINNKQMPRFEWVSD